MWLRHEGNEEIAAFFVQPIGAYIDLCVFGKQTVICDKHQNFESRRLKHSSFWLTVMMEVFVCSAEASAVPPSGPSEFWDTWTCCFWKAREQQRVGFGTGIRK